jgi:hypothetical protein
VRRVSHQHDESGACSRGSHIVPSPPNRAPSLLREAILFFSEKLYIRTRHAAARGDCSEGKQVYFVRGMDTSNITLDTEEFETVEEALQRACAIEKTGALVELFQDDNPASIMDFAQVSAWCRAKSQHGD